MMFFCSNGINMMILLALLLTAAVKIYISGCDLSNLLLDEGPEATLPEQSPIGYLVTFYTPVTIFSDSGDTIQVSLWGNGKICLDVSRTPDCNSDFAIMPIYPTNMYPYAERGAMFYWHTTDQNELIKLRNYLDPNFDPHLAVILTYHCIGVFENEKRLTFQVIVVTGKDTEGSDRTILLMTMGHYYEVDKSNGLIGRSNLWKHFTVSNGQTKSFDITNITEWEASLTVKCIIRRNADMTTFDGSEKNMTNGKQILAEWNPGNDDCKFKLMAIIQQDAVMWVRFAVGVHKNKAKFARLFDFNRPPGKIYQRGWKCQAGCKGIITTFDHDITNDGTVYATLKEVDPGQTYVIDSELCADGQGPNYKMTFNFEANDDDSMATLELSRAFYDANKDDLVGYCIP
ncbi:hypothetical protein LSH36_1661g00033 [Paralvinella palmiformis]|uniref:Uncharacterized protein n=1 Tax=Paralvinella palmiformis TaxID=53620 RepID=A0AAD9ITA3_9ANNE|nr:hypothetical protein LSH36_1661g00033 [Paralvinella palmiformis]